MDYKLFFNRVFYFILFPFLCISYCLTPLTHDIQTFIGVGRIADLFYPFPQGLDLAWEIKPIGNRVVNWALYKVATLFVSFDNAILFGIAVKVIALCVVLLVSYYLSTQIRAWYTFPLVFLSLTAVSDINILQAEYWAVIVALVCVGLLINDNQFYSIPAGFLFVFLALLKGITILLCFPVLCMVYLLSDPDWISPMLAIWGALVGGYITILLDVNVFHHIVSDMLMASQIAHVGIYSITTLLLYGTLWTFYYLPSTPLAFFAVFVGLFLFIVMLGKHDYKTASVFSLMWLVPLAMVFIQGEFMIYHYFPLTLPALGTLFIWERGV